MSRLVSPDRRISLIAQPATAAASPALEVVFVGEAAAAPNFTAASLAVAAATQLGFAPADTSLNNLPLGFSAIDAFSAAFPGDDSWLARAVGDFFNAGGSYAWVVRVDGTASSPLDAQLRALQQIVAIPPPTGVEIAMQIPSAGLLLLPDLEALCLASVTPPPPPPAGPPEATGFRPIGDFLSPPASSDVPAAPATPVSPQEVVARVSAALAANRPDMLCLFALPLGADQSQSVSALVRRASAYVHGTAGTDRPQVQAFAPLLRDANGNIASPSGLIAGVLATTAQTDGVWRSIAGQQLPLGGTPLRRIESNALAELRRAGIVPLRFVPGGTAVDDDILACRDTPANAAIRAAGTRRLMGWLVRQLQVFGEQLVFENVLDDGRVELILMDLFDTLQRRGALNGKQVSDAVLITRPAPPESNAVEFDIQVAAAVAVETIRLRFLDGTLTTTLGAAA